MALFHSDKDYSQNNERKAVINKVINLSSQPYRQTQTLKAWRRAFEDGSAQTNEWKSGVKVSAVMNEGFGKQF